MDKHTILFLAANPAGTALLALDEEARAIHVELQRSGHRDRFVLATRWAAQPLDLLRELRELKPTVVHFSGHGGQLAPSGHRPGRAPRRDVVDDRARDAQDGLFFQGRDGRPQRVSSEALQQAFGAAGSSVRLVVFNACYSTAQAEALRTCVDCVVGMRSAIDDRAARSFAIGFYGGLGDGEPVARAFEQGRAAISLEGLHDSDRPQLQVRPGVDATRMILADPASTTSAASAPASPGVPSHAEPYDHARLHDRLLKVADPLFEQIVFRAGIDRSWFSAPSVALAQRAVEVARLAGADRDLCRRLAMLLDQHVPWTSGPSQGSPGASRAATGDAGPAAVSDAGSDTGPDAGAPSAELLERLSRMKREVTEILMRRPRAFQQLSDRIGCVSKDLADRLVNLRGSTVADHVFSVSDAQPATSDGDKDRAALQAVLFSVLPYVSDWQSVVDRCCARGEGQNDVVELDYRSDTIAEAVMAGWGNRQCAFMYEPNREPFGAAVVQLPATEHAPLFPSEEQLLEDVVEQLRRQLGTGGLTRHERRLEVEEELRLQGGRPGPQRMRYYFLFRDAAPLPDGHGVSDPGARWEVARNALHGESGLPSLVLVRMRGGLDADQAALNRRVAAILKPRTPPRP